MCPPHSLLPIVRLFITSMSLVIFCLLFSSIAYVPVKGDVIWYLSLTVWLISLNIMLSSSIHAVVKGISSFFLLHRIPLCKYTIVRFSSSLYLLLLYCVLLDLPILDSVAPEHTQVTHK